MKIFLISLLVATISAANEDRSLQLTGWLVSLGTVSDQQFTFDVGSGDGSNANLKVEIYDKCSVEGAGGVYQGELYPSNNVAGITAITSGVTGLGTTGNTISFYFHEGIEQNTFLYEDIGDDTAIVKFCALIGIYNGDEIVNFAEVKFAYQIELSTAFVTLTGSAVTQATPSQAAGSRSAAFDGNVDAYFCDPVTKLETGADRVSTQGLLLHVCFKASSGQFQVKDVLELTIADATSSTSQSIIENGAIHSSTPYGMKSCTDVGDYDNNICLVEFLLRANFYVSDALTLSGSGRILLELGHAGGRIRRNLRSSTEVQRSKLGYPGVIKTVMVKPAQFETAGIRTKASSSANMYSLAATFAIAVLVSFVGAF